MIIILNVFLIIGVLALIFYNRANLTGNAVSDFSEGSGISDYYQKTIDIDYENGLEKEIEFYVFNTEHQNMKVLLTVQGDLNNSVALYDSLVDFLPSDESKKFKYKFKMPEIGNEPGLHQAQIIALEIPNISPGGNYASSSSKTVGELKVHVPYPGKYIDADLNILDAEQNGTAKLVVYAVNRGKSDISAVKARIDIYTLLNEKISSIETDSKSIDPSKTAELSADWKINSAAGDYIAKITLTYDGETREFEKRFAVGAKNLTIEGILVNNFQLGGIAKLQILVDNKWNQELKGVYANLIVYDTNGQVMADTKSSSDNIPALAKKELIAYWDTGKVEEGEYNTKLTINYEDRTVTKDLVFRVSQTSLDVFGIGYVIRPKIMQGGTITTVLLVLVIILVLVNLSWFTWWMRNKIKK
ncbi:Uncharacterised protein [uncultured archaeon]|nr:Uncharacterised protein [uncultured archaeon]